MNCDCGWTKAKEAIWLQHLFYKIWRRPPTSEEQRLIFKGLEAKK
jgi:hypothetical protein